MFAEAYAETNKTVKAGVYAREAGITGPEIALQGLRFGRTMQAYFNAAEKMEESEDEEEYEPPKGLFGNEKIIGQRRNSAQ